ncbi:transposase-like protein [Lysinibacillus sp. TE18511]
MFEEGHYSISELCERFSVNDQTLYRWRIKYEAGGRDGLQEATSCKFYSKELKLAAVEDYIQELRDLAAQFRV